MTAMESFLYPSRYTTLSRTPDQSLKGLVHTHLSASSSTGDGVLLDEMRVGWISKRRDIGHVASDAAYGAFLPSLYLSTPRHTHPIFVY